MDLKSISRIGCLAAAVVSFMVASTPVDAERDINRAELLRLADVHKTRIENHRTPLYFDLLSSSDSANQRISDNPDIQLMYISDNGRPVYYVTENLNAARTVGVNRVWPGGGAGESLTGLGTLISQFAVWDGGGVRVTHQEFGGRVIQVDSPPATSTHSTHVAGTMVAAGLIPAAKGMSYEAGLAAYDWNFDESEMAAAAAAGLQLSNHSYGVATGWRYDGGWYWHGDVDISPFEDYHFGFYDEDARELDEIAFDAPNYLIVQSVGNDRNDTGPEPGGEHLVWDGGWVLSTDTRDPDGGGYGFDCIPGRKTAKNMLVVGAVNDIPAGYTQPSDVVQTDFSSWGPSDDGRIKPDIVANGAGLYSCSDAGDAAYTTMGGTSMSSPNAAGAINLLIRHYESVMGASPRAATMKGIVIQTAHEAGPAVGPDYANGWGLLNTEGAADYIQTRTGIIERTLRNGAVDYYSFSVDSARTVKLTIAWTDIPGEPLSPVVNPRTAMLENDLDVRVEHVATAAVYEPWVLDFSYPADPATPGDNIVDNVEQVYIALADSGDYWVSVTHKGSLAHEYPWFVDDQDYSILCSEPLMYEPSYHHYVSDSGLNIHPYDTPAKAAHTIADAVAVAETGDTVFVESDDHYVESLTLTQGIVLSGAWDAGFSVRNIGAGETMIYATGPISVDAGSAPVVIDGFIIQGGVGIYGGGLRVFNSDLTVVNCIVRQNEAFNGSFGYGGGIHAVQSTIRVIESVVSNNSASRGGGIYLDGCTGSIEHSTISNNRLLYGTEAPNGGGLCITNSSMISLVGNNITGNMVVAASAPMVNGGGIFLENTTGFSMHGDSVSYNLADVSVSWGNGGGICILNSDATITDVDFLRNSSKLIGGAVYGDTGSLVVMTGCRVMWNSALIGGGAYLTGAESTVDHNLFVGNDADGCFILSASSGSFIGNTFDRNIGATAGGVFFSNTAIPVFNNIVVNSAGPGIKCSGAPTPTPAYNNVWNNSGADYAGCAPGAGSVSADPLFADTSLADYHLALHSPGIDAGDADPAYNDPDESRGDQGWFGSHVFDMEQPQCPKNFEVSITGGDAVLTWSANPEPDVEYYAVYKDTVAGFVPSDSSFVMLVAAPDTTYNDGPAEFWTYYVISAIDTSGYASGYAAAVQVDPTGFGAGVVSYTDRLDQNYPNPFNPNTRIGYQLRSRVPVRLNVYDVGGRLVRQLLDDNQGPGNFTVQWDGRNMHGATVSTGVYFYRISAGSFVRTKKMVMLK